MMKTKFASELVTGDRINFAVSKDGKYIPMTDDIYTIRDMGSQIVITTFESYKLTYHPNDRVSLAKNEDFEPMVRFGYADVEQVRGISVT